ncbi:MAG: hypothetical protein IPP74_11345 [Alphaproteobacteria bacterium]|nr:hypothetical protein [Alphaproteobacteria bacterium]
MAQMPPVSGTAGKQSFIRWVIYGTAIACVLPFILNLAGISLGLPYQYINLTLLLKMTPLEQMTFVQKSLLGANFYALVEWIACMLAAVAMVFSVSYYNYSKHFLLFWLSFLLMISGIWNGLSALLSIQYYDTIYTQKISLILVWLLGQCCVALIALLAGIWYVKKPHQMIVVNRKLFSLLLIKVSIICFICMAALLATDAFHIISRSFQGVEHAIDTLSLLLFIGNTVLYVYIHHKTKDLVSFSLILWSFIGVLHEIVVAFSPDELYGNGMYVATYLKIISYIALLIMLIKEYHRIHQSSICDIGSAIERYQQEIIHYTHELQRSNQELDDFCYVVSHDLKEPLRGIHNYSTFLQQDYGDKMDENGNRMLNSITRLSSRMEGLLEALLYYSQVGRVELAVKETDINEIVDKVLETLEPLIEEKKIELKIPRHFPIIRCDHIRVAEVFRNLVVNAIKYNDKEHKSLEIGWLDKKRDNKTVFYVKDNGIGINKDQFEAIFKIFKRLHGQEQFGGGTGSGLTIIKKILERMNNIIWLESEVGKGTTFFFTLGE